MAKGTKYDQQFKENALRYRLDHPELSLQKAAENLEISDSALKTWIRAVRENEGSVPIRGFENYSSSEAKEIARQQRELMDTKYSKDGLWYSCDTYDAGSTESI